MYLFKKNGCTLTSKEKEVGAAESEGQVWTPVYDVKYLLMSHFQLHFYLFFEQLIHMSFLYSYL